ncbi:MSMEG_0567/sll0787 family protein [Microbacterium gilvum]|uniref:GNAT family N-acetyltransferase n=1 Tax=Microbacterium gilvum TaxID=1336204 RepID=A0ABP9AG98_9MICO
MLEIPAIMGPVRERTTPAWVIRRADGREIDAYCVLRRDVFVAEQGVFGEHDRDDVDDDPRTIVLVAKDAEGDVLGGVRLAPATAGRDIGWWTGSRLVVRADARHAGGIGPALVREACATALRHGVLRFEATVQHRNEVLFRRLGWTTWGAVEIGGMRHARMRWPITRIRDLVESTKTGLGPLLGDLRHDAPFSLGGAGFVGDDGAPVPGTDVVAACDAILPALIEHDPEWAGWCAVLVNLNDLAAMGATPVGMLDAIGAPSAEVARRVVGGLRSAAHAWSVPLLGGHTQLGVPAALAVTALGRTARPVPGGGARRGDDLSLTIDLHGRWRRGFEGRQWDSTSARTGDDLRALGALVRDARPAAAKDVSMAGIVGTTAMLAEASSVGAVLEPAAIPAPDAVSFGDWLTCFPGFGMVTADRPGRSRMSSPIAQTARIGTATAARGVRLLWPDGIETDAVGPTATGLLPD